MDHPKYLSGLYKEFRDSGSISNKEPYRQLLAEVRDKLVNTKRKYDDLLTGRAKDENYTHHGPVYLEDVEMAQPLMLIYNSLIDEGLQVIADGRLLDILRRLACFGLSFVKLDLRQEADRHTEVLDTM